MGGKVLFKVDDSGARAKLQALLDASADMRPAFATVGRSIKTRIDLCFKMGIDPWGSPWTALKIRKGGQPLKDRNLTGLSKIISKPDQTGVTIGTAAQRKIGATHQFGATIKPKNGKYLVFPGPGGKTIFAKKVVIPARPFLPLRKGDVVALPPAWSVAVKNALRAYFVRTAAKTEGGQ